MSVLGGVEQWAPDLETRHVQHCRVYPTRYAMVAALVPLRGKGVEVGAGHGFFAQFVIGNRKPVKYVIIDDNFGQLWRDPNPLLADPCVVEMEGNSGDLVPKLIGGDYDWVYVDANHGYDFVVEDLANAEKIVHDEGLILCNDYTSWSAMSSEPYGVQRAVNEFLLAREGRWEMIGFAFQGAGYHDVALRRVRDVPIGFNIRGHH